MRCCNYATFVNVISCTFLPPTIISTGCINDAYNAKKWVPLLVHASWIVWQPGASFIIVAIFSFAILAKWKAVSNNVFLLLHSGFLTFPQEILFIIMLNGLLTFVITSIHMNNERCHVVTAQRNILLFTGFSLSGELVFNSFVNAFASSRYKYIFSAWPFTRCH